VVPGTKIRAHHCRVGPNEGWIDDKGRTIRAEFNFSGFKVVLLEKAPK
jgi:hypothetical protein